jgi:putative transposase
MEYRRLWVKGGAYFFTVNCLKRQNNTILIDHIELLRQSIATVKRTHPFKIHAWVVLPDHMHCVIELPENDHDYATRWRLIKLIFSRGIPQKEYRSDVRRLRNERGLWQRRYWEHLIRDEADYKAHMDYVHINPLKHGLVKQVIDWPYSTFHQLVEQGVYAKEWAGGFETSLEYED